MFKLRSMEEFWHMYLLVDHVSARNHCGLLHISSCAVFPPAPFCLPPTSSMAIPFLLTAVCGAHRKTTGSWVSVACTPFPPMSVSSV